MMKRCPKGVYKRMKIYDINDKNPSVILLNPEVAHQVLVNSGSRTRTNMNTFFYDIQPEFKNGKLASRFPHFVLRHRIQIFTPRLNPKH